MNDYRKSLRTVGNVIIIIGVLDIALMVYSIATWASYSSSLNVIAVMAGILLRRGSLKAARAVAFSAALILTCAVGLVLVMPFVLQVPLDLVMVYLRLHPLNAAEGGVLVICALVLPAWVYCRLTAPEILSALEEQQIAPAGFWQTLRTGFMVGALLVVVMTGILLSLFMTGGTAERAKIEAGKRVGSTYKLFVYSLSTSSSNGHKTVRATVAAYKPNEIRTVELTWEE